MALMDTLADKKVIAIARGLALETMDVFAQALYDGGIGLLEVTFQQNKPETWKDTANAIGHLRALYDGRMHIGAGTVMTPEQLRMAREGGAEYIVSPNVDERIIQTTKEMGMGSFPGAMTPSEAAAAHAYGADAVKIFPAGALGAAYVEAIKAPLSHIKFLAVGGVNENNAGEFIRAGAMGVGIGGNLTRESLIRAGAFDQIRDVARACAKAVRAV